MRAIPPKRLAAIPAAIDARLTVIELSEAEREAALKMPIKDALRELAQRTQQELETHLLLMVEAYLDADLGDPKQIAGRLTLHPDSPYTTIDGVPQLVAREDRGETYAMDGHPVLWVGPVKLERAGGPGGEEMKASRSFRYFLKPRGEAANDQG